MNWKEFDALELAEGSFASPWRMALGFIEDANILKLAAEGEWEALPGISPLCGPDGLAAVAAKDDALILAGIPLGALIGKLGGSSAGLEAAGAATDGAATAAGAFAIGTGCLVPVPVGKNGPLFIAFNSRVRPLAVKRLKLSISGAVIAS